MNLAAYVDRLLFPQVCTVHLIFLKFTSTGAVRTTINHDNVETILGVSPWVEQINEDCVRNSFVTR